MDPFAEINEEDDDDDLDEIPEVDSRPADNMLDGFDFGDPFVNGSVYDKDAGFCN